MTELAKCREDFCRKVNQFVSHPGERQRFIDVLDDFIAWSLKHVGALEHQSDSDQDVVAFRRHGDGAVLWAAFPRRYDGARFELLPGKKVGLTAESRQDAVAVIQPLADGPIGETSKLLVPFLSLKRAATRQQIKDLMDRVLVS